MELIRAGYKRTEVGVIPMDWEVFRLGDLGDCIIGLTYSPSDVSSYGTLVLRSSNVQSGRLCFDDNVYVTCEISDKIRTRTGDILICVRNGSRNLIGKAAKIEGDGTGQTFGAFMSIFRTELNGIIFQAFFSDIIKKQIEANLGATINQITNAMLNSFMIPLPPNKAEQNAIATALGDADGLITGLETLIAKKRAIKEGTMQELLSGKRRLPGFQGEWVEEEFGELAKRRKEKNTSSPSDGQVFCVELEHIQPSTGMLLGHLDTIPASSVKAVFKKDDVLFGRLRAYLKKYWFASNDGLSSTEIWALEPIGKVRVSRYLYFMVQTAGFLMAASESYGTHMPRTDWNAVSKTTFRIPVSLEEQAAISEILSDMDAEIATLETKLQKARAIKAGMMAELLTGNIRLI